MYLGLGVMLSKETGSKRGQRSAFWVLCVCVERWGETSGGGGSGVTERVKRGG